MNRPSENKSGSSKLDGKPGQDEKINRRSWVRKGVKAAYVVPAVLAVKAAYVVPAVLAAIKATENPVIAQSQM
jgi:hypothetical protein